MGSFLCIYTQANTHQDFLYRFVNAGDHRFTPPLFIFYSLNKVKAKIKQGNTSTVTEGKKTRSFEY